MKDLYPYFSQNPLNRLDFLRTNPKEVFNLIDSKNSFFIVFDGSEIIIDDENRNCLFSKEILDEYNIENEELVFLGEFEDNYYFTFTLNKNLKTNLSKVSIREFVKLDILDETMFGVIAQASSVLNWHSSHKFCSNCGEKTVITKVGWRRDCPSCKKEHFPRIDSVVIMLVTFEEYCLLGRGVNFKEGRYSCLAGFMESGETLEDAAKRELFEEVGIEGKNAQYLFSQPWPFPNSLMIGMRLEAKSQGLVLDENEIADAIWVHKTQVKDVLAGKESFFTIPDEIAIARNLLEVWVEE